jgi:hypothetical protein
MSTARKQRVKTLSCSQFDRLGVRRQRDLKIARDIHLRSSGLRGVGNTARGNLHASRHWQIVRRGINSGRRNHTHRGVTARHAVHAPHHAGVRRIGHRCRERLHIPQNDGCARRSDRHRDRARRAGRCWRRSYKPRANRSTTLQPCSKHHTKPIREVACENSTRVAFENSVPSSCGKGRMPQAMQANNQRKRVASAVILKIAIASPAIQVSRAFLKN